MVGLGNAHGFHGNSKKTNVAMHCDLVIVMGQEGSIILCTAMPVTGRRSKVLVEAPHDPLST